MYKINNCKKHTLSKTQKKGTIDYVTKIIKQIMYIQSVMTYSFASNGDSTLLMSVDAVFGMEAIRSSKLTGASTSDGDTKLIDLTILPIEPLYFPLSLCGAAETLDGGTLINCAGACFDCTFFSKSINLLLIAYN